MTRTAAVGRLGSEFDDFLFAPVAEEKNGMLLSVVSALARTRSRSLAGGGESGRVADGNGDPETGVDDRGTA